jgi:hypothetical protein
MDTSGQKQQSTHERTDVVTASMRPGGPAEADRWEVVMKRIYVCLAMAAMTAMASLLPALPAVADPPVTTTCEPTFQAVVRVEGVADFVETALGRPLTSAELAGIPGLLDKLDLNGDDTLCAKVAADTPGAGPIVQFVENHLPLH